MKIVFLHGIGTGDPNGGWLAGLNRGLVEGGFPEVDDNRIIAPRYNSLLSTSGVSAKLPPVTYRTKDDSRARRGFERRQAKVQRKLGLDETVRSFGWNRFPEGPLSVGQQLGINSLAYWDLPHGKRYMQSEGLRAAILKRILDDLPGNGDIVHSLGSVVAIDLLDNLHEGLHVRRVITIGSPASSRYLHEGSDRLLKTFPYARVDDWWNFFDARDVVTGGRGLATTFPGA